MNLCHVRDAARGGDITATWSTPGRFLRPVRELLCARAGHAEPPLRGFLPGELWESPLWVSYPVRQHALPAIRTAPAAASFDRPTVAAFPAARRTPSVLARLLTASTRRSTAAPLVLRARPARTTRIWIAGVSYLLGDVRAREMPLFTYTPAPGRVPSARDRNGPRRGRRPWPLGGRLPRPRHDRAHPARTWPRHPLAVLLAQVGVLRAAACGGRPSDLPRERSARWTSGTGGVGRGGLLGIEPLPSAAVGAIADWLPLAPPQLRWPDLMSRPCNVLLDRDRSSATTAPAPAAGSERGRGHRPPATHRGHPGGRAVAQLARDDAARAHPDGTAEGIELAVTSCERLLVRPMPPLTITVLDWAREVGLQPDPLLVDVAAVTSSGRTADHERGPPHRPGRQDIPHSAPAWRHTSRPGTGNGRSTAARFSRRAPGRQ